MRQRLSSRLADLCLCALVPAVLFWLTRSFYQLPPQGNAINHDPDWYYLGNAVRVASGTRIFYVGHPGIPVSLLAGALVFLRAHLLPIEPGAGLVAEVLTHAPEYHAYLGTSILLLNVAALWAFGLFLQRRSLPRPLVLLCQASLLLSPMVLWYGGRVMPEALAPVAGLAVGAFLLNEATMTPGWRSGALLSAALGVVGTVKLNFLPYMLFTAARGWRRAVPVLLGAALTFWFATQLLDPVRREVFWSFHQGVLTHQGRYSLGAPGLPGSQLLWQNFWELWSESRLLFGQFLGLAAFAACAGLIAARWPAGPARRMVFLFVALVLLLFAGQLKQSGARYALPAYVLVPSLLALLWRQEASAFLRAGLIALPLLAAAGSAPLYLEDLRNRSSGRLEARELQARMESEFLAHPGCMHLFQDAVQNYRWANFSADDETGHIYSTELRALYPRTWVYSDGLGFFRAYGRDAVTFEAFARELRAARCVLFYLRERPEEALGRPIFASRAWRSLVETRYARLVMSGQDP